MVEIPNYFVVIMGVGTVFIGLICIIILCKIIGICTAIGSSQESNENKSTAPAVANVPVASQPIENKQEIIAAVSAVVAEELGTDVSAIRILSFKKI